MRGKHKRLAGTLAPFEFRKRSCMVFVPRADGRHEGAGIAEVSGHRASCHSLADEEPERRLADVASTSAAVNTGRPSRGTATTVEPRRSSETFSGTGSISTRPP